MKISSIRDLHVKADSLKGKYALLRVDFNVPIDDHGKVREADRIIKSFISIDFLRTLGMKVVLISHIEGKGETKGASTVSLKPVFEYIQKNLPKLPITFSPTLFGADVDAAQTAMKEGDVLLLENLRSDDGEKNNDLIFAKNLALYGDIYINDAFPVCHRKHASIVSLPQFLPHYAGFTLVEEIERIAKAFHPPRPLLFILGGAKFDTKIPLIEKFLAFADKVFVGGALANNFFKEQGLEVGQSLVSDGDFHLKKYFDDKKLMLPQDVIVKNVKSGTASSKPKEFIHTDEVVVDIGPESLADVEHAIAKSKFILWNGPMGNYEDGFRHQTLGIAEAIIRSGKEAVLGGGDTVAAIASLSEKGLNTDHKVFVSTGGGAMLEYLLNETLPGIEALKKDL